MKKSNKILGYRKDGQYIGLIRWMLGHEPSSQEVREIHDWHMNFK